MKPVLELSILMPGVPSRMPSQSLLNVLAQAKDKPVEVLFLLDNKARSIGQKRGALLNLAQGNYFTFVDDDDEALPGYVDTLLKEIKDKPDLIVFPLQMTKDGWEKTTIHYSIHHQNEKYLPNAIVKRRPIPFMCWRRELVQDIPFPDMMLGEDHFWGDIASLRVKRQKVLTQSLYHYKWNGWLTEAK